MRLPDNLRPLPFVAPPRYLNCSLILSRQENGQWEWKLTTPEPGQCCRGNSETGEWLSDRRCHFNQILASRYTNPSVIVESITIAGREQLMMQVPLILFWERQFARVRSDLHLSSLGEGDLLRVKLSGSAPTAVMFTGSYLLTEGKTV